MELKYGPTYGNETVLISGEFLAHPKREEVGPAFDTEVTVAGVECIKVSVISREKVICEIPTAKPGPALVEVCGFGSCSVRNNNSIFTYEPPKVLELFPRHGKFYGNTNLTIVGNNFGNADTTTTVVIDGLPCKDVGVHSSRLLRCRTPPGVKAQAPIKVIVEGVSSLGKHIFTYNNHMPSYTFDPPIVESIFPVTGSAIGRDNVTIRGKLFGKKDDAAKPVALIDGIPCLKTVWHSETELSCVTPPAKLTSEIIRTKFVSVGVSVIIRGMPSPEVGKDIVAFGYERPVVLQIKPVKGQVTVNVDYG